MAKKLIYLAENLSRHVFSLNSSHFDEIFEGFKALKLIYLAENLLAPWISYFSFKFCSFGLHFTSNWTKGAKITAFITLTWSDTQNLRNIRKVFVKNLQNIRKIFAKYSRSIREKFTKNLQKIKICKFFMNFSRIFCKF